MTTDTGQAVVLSLPCPPTKPLSMNTAIGMHWAAYARHMDPWRDAIAWVAKAHRSEIQAMAKPVTIGVTLRFKRGARRDSANFYPCSKSLCDGLVHAGCLPDDSPAYATILEPVLLVDKTDQSVTLTITPHNTGATA